MTSKRDEPRTLADVTRLQAAQAMVKGEASLADGDVAWARAWFERARRFVPNDPAVAVALAGVLLRIGDPGAGALFAEAAREVDTREVWLGMAAACLGAGDRAGARSALARALAGHVLPAEAGTFASLAKLACLNSEIVGWCGVARTQDGVLRWVAGVDDARATVDGDELVGFVLPEDGRSLRVTFDGHELLGSPIDLARLRRVEGFVSADGRGLSGWAWHPAEADHDPCITIVGSSGSRFVRATGSELAALKPMTQPRRFAVEAADLQGLGDVLAVMGSDGRALSGSPLDLSAPVRAAIEMARLASLECPATGQIAVLPRPTDLSAPAALIGPSACAPLRPLRPVAVVMPVYGGGAVTRACLESVFASCTPDTKVIVVDDDGPDPDLAEALDAIAASGRITLIRHTSNKGFPSAANDGLRAAFALEPPHDALLLNSDTLLPVSRGVSWLARLRAAVQSQPDIGTASPFSNDATILSYPLRDGPNSVPDRVALGRLAAQAAKANADGVIDIPTSVGFCMYVRRECAEATGLFRTSLFAQGYGEENDFCIRARHLGWRHVAVPGVFVAHVGGASFGAARAPLIARNLAVLERLHPGYHALIAAYQGAVPAEDALAPARLRLDRVRFAEERRPSSVIIVTHDSGGGVERVVRGRLLEIAAAGLRAIVVRPVHDPDSEGGFLPDVCRVGDGADASAFPNLVFRLPQDTPALLRLLRAEKPALFEVHHRLGLPDGVIGLAARLGIPTEYRVHDYAAFCPRITLLGGDRRYCGEPTEIAACEDCVADHGDRTGENLAVAALRARSSDEFALASRVVVPSSDMAGRLRRHFPALRAEIAPLEDDASFGVPPPPPDTLPRRICVIGAIGVEKGFDVLLACARDAARRQLPLEFLLVGHSTDDARLIDTGRVFVTGRYAEAEACDLVRAQAAHLAFLPSIWPETWGFTLGLAWRAGLQAAVFDIGAMAARVRASGHGLLLPLGLPASGINNVLLQSVIVTIAGAQQDRLWTRQGSAI